MIKPSIPKGTRDFSPALVAKRNHIFDTIRTVFRRHGFQPLETPALEMLQTLTGKYGEEGDKLMFRVLNNGDIFSQAAGATDSRQLADAVTEKALRYDLTIPFARYVVMHQHELAFPFKRYQIQPVWRADRPQKGRYREFCQCDADIVGSDSLLNEIELLEIYDEVFRALGLSGSELRVNNRKILAGLSEVIGMPESLTDMTIAIDKLDKIGPEGVRSELADRGFPPEAVAVINGFLEISGDGPDKLRQLETLLASSPTARKGIAELSEVLDSPLAAWSSAPVFDQTLARGLNYYTGIIIEAKAPSSVKIGSIGGGGRYDDLTGLFGLAGISGVGISFGVDRIYDVLEELQLFPEMTGRSTTVLFLHLDAASLETIYPLLRALRAGDVAAELYPDPAKFDKQMKYADKRGIPYIVIAGEGERAEGVVSLKDMRSGVQEKLRPEALLNRFLGTAAQPR